MKNIIICDLDGTLCDIEHRRVHVTEKPKDWKAFFDGMENDTVNEAVMSVLDMWIGNSDEDADIMNEVIFCTGRPEKYRAATEAWLDEHYGIPITGRQLHMRKDGDYRPDDIVKEEILNTNIDKDRVFFVLDDRQQVVDMWRRNGLQCFQVAEGNF